MNGENQTVERLMGDYGDYVLRVCRLALGDAGMAEDAYQETWLKVWRALPRFRGDSSIRTWIIRIAINTCRDAQRTAWFRHFRAGAGEDALRTIPAPEREEKSGVAQAISSLPPRYREAAALYYLSEMTIADVARALGVNPNTASTRIRRGREQLRKILEGGAADE